MKTVGYTWEELIGSRSAVNESGCRIWQLGKRTGYGMVSWLGRKHMAHRLSYELANGQRPGEMKVLHRCDTPLCVNPEHLFLGTQADNVADMVAKKRHRTGPGSKRGHPLQTECKRGHPLDMTLTDKRLRKCKVCKVALAHAGYLRKKARKAAALAAVSAKT